MENLVYQSSKGNPITDSKLIAKKFGKRNSDVLRDIRNLHCSDDFRKRNFALRLENNELQTGGSTKSETYIMTKDGFSFLVMGYNGKVAGKFKEDFINAFNKMEAHIKSLQHQVPKTFAEALQLASDQAKKLEQHQQQLTEQKPKVIFADAVIQSKSSCLISELAKILAQNGVKIGQNRLFEYLREHGYLCYYGGRYNQPTQQYVDQGLFEIAKSVIIKPNGENIVTTTTRVTGKGQQYFTEKFLSS